VRTFREASDDELLRACGRHPEAFDEFYLRHERLVVAFFRRRTASPDIAIDLTAETFVAALASARRYRPGDQPAVAWLFGIARNKLLVSTRKGRVEDRARRRLGLQRIEIDDDELDRVDRLGGLNLLELLGSLPPAQADAIRVRVLEERSYAEAAVRLQCSELVARKRVSRGLATMRQLIEEES
jgi:RNA polymerase sigma-70 factor (ECF subfamily)